MCFVSACSTSEGEASEAGGEGVSTCASCHESPRRIEGRRIDGVRPGIPDSGSGTSSSRAAWPLYIGGTGGAEGAGPPALSSSRSGLEALSIGGEARLTVAFHDTFWKLGGVFETRLGFVGPTRHYLSTMTMKRFYKSDWGVSAAFFSKAFSTIKVRRW